MRSELYPQKLNCQEKHYKMNLNQLDDNMKAHLCLLLMIFTFVILTFIAFLMNEGKLLLIYPVVRMVYPNARFLKQYDTNRRQTLEHIFATSQYAFGKKRGTIKSTESCSEN